LTKPLTLDDARRHVAAVEEALRAGHPPGGQHGPNVKTATRVAGDALGIHRKIFADRLSPGGYIETRFGLKVDWSQFTPRADAAPLQDHPKAPAAGSLQPDPPTRTETRDASFWRTRFLSLERDLHNVERVLAEISGLAAGPFYPPEWFAAAPSGGVRKRSAIGHLISDVHMGEVIDPREVMGINAYDPDIARARMQRYFESAAALGPMWAQRTECMGALIAWAGDLTSGDIHDELARTNALTSNEQVLAMVELCIGGIKLMKRTYGKVHNVFVPGNHGRQTPKPTAKLYARLNYDTLIGKLVALAFADDKDVTFQIADGRDVVTVIFGRTIFTTHGDGMGTGGGQGFAGPLLPIVRGTKKVEAQQARMEQRPDLILHGHYHTSANPGPVLSNGSVPGYSEYGNGLRASVEPPQQWLFMLQEKWGLAERTEIKLADPAPPRPIRVQALTERT
jgi:hypothetical protein